MITIPFSKSVKTVNLTPSIGQFLFDEPTKVVMPFHSYLILSLSPPS